MKYSFAQGMSALLMVIVASVAYGICYSIISVKSAVVADLQHKIAIKNETATRIASARVALAEISSDEAAVQNYFVPQTEVVRFINDIEGFGRTLGTIVSVLSVSTSGTLSQPMLSFTLTVEGTFDAVMRTVGAIEYAPYALSISTLTLGQETKNSWHANLILLVGSVLARAATSTPSTTTSTP